jgi:hypothetical protein
VFEGDVRLAAAAYISGESRILSAGLRYSNAAVFHYVQKVVRQYQKNRVRRLQIGPPSETESKGGNFP